jgi:NAD(P)-dependent dehydrogenase (short-subunit alcohol dehydrogenase family)
VTAPANAWPAPSAADPGRFGLGGKVAVITGATRGLGLAIAGGFSRAGAVVVVVSRKAEACEKAAAALRADGGSAVGRACHVGHWDEVTALAGWLYDEFGRVDVLVNNAGISPLYERLSEVTEDQWDKVIGVNLKGPFRLSATIGTRMAAPGGVGGSIINISSIAAIRPDATILPYAAAKAGLNALTEGYAKALAPKVRVNAIMCGMFRTDIAKAWGDPGAVDAAARETIALQRIGEPSEVVGAALYLASDASSYCTGAVLRLDGGAA